MMQSFFSSLCCHGNNLKQTWCQQHNSWIKYRVYISHTIAKHENMQAFLWLDTQSDFLSLLIRYRTFRCHLKTHENTLKLLSSLHSKAGLLGSCRIAFWEILQIFIGGRSDPIHTNKIHNSCIGSCIKECTLGVLCT